MTNMTKIFAMFAVLAMVLGAGTALAAVPQVQTSGVANIQGTSAVLSGYLLSLGGNFSNSVWFQWGTTTSYGNETTHQTQGSLGNFSQTISGLVPNTIYHFRAAAQNADGISFGQNVSFTTTSSSGGALNFVIAKRVINLTSGNLNWSSSVSANSNDVLSFAITFEAQNQAVSNITVRDVMPANLIYRGNLTVNASLSNESITNGINIGSIPAGGVAVISYQAQVAPASNLAYGVNSLSNNAFITSNETGLKTVSATVLVNNYTVPLPTDVPTGIANNFFTDSFFLPLLIILFVAWFYFSGRAHRVADWIKSRRA